jgi:hypothetical protein
MPDPYTADTQLEAEIEELLEALKALLDKIAPLRQRAATIEADLVVVQRDYEQKLHAANARADQLELLKHSLLARLVGSDPPSASPAPRSTPPPAVIADQGAAAAADIPSDPPEAVRKRELVAHVRYFTDDRAVIERINALLKDPRRDVGDLLELLPWGEIWQVRAADWETLADQYARLTRWRAALQERLVRWQREVRHLEDDSRYPLLVRKTASSVEGWQSYLDELARRQQAENIRLAREVEVLQEQLAARVAEEG